MERVGRIPLGIMVSHNFICPKLLVDILVYSTMLQSVFRIALLYLAVGMGEVTCQQ